MGLFLSVIAVHHAPRKEFLAALNDYATKNRIQFDTEVPIAEEDMLRVLVTDDQRVAATLPGGFAEHDDLACFLSQRLATASFAFHIHDGDLWMYTLYDNGDEVDHFNPIPAYWGELTPEQKRDWSGDPTKVAAHWEGVDASSVAPYLVEWDLESLGKSKAFHDDEFAIGHDWQLVDFMRRLGLKYPDTNTRGVEVFRFGPPRPAEIRATKPWWKLW
ncbi:MAG: hypothetical protein H7Z14_20495 [Anaerolineae bacterium]|nr:hypothetical protein [Phycisphaerae bacterium]